MNIKASRDSQVINTKNILKKAVGKNVVDMVFSEKGKSKGL